VGVPLLLLCMLLALLSREFQTRLRALFDRQTSLIFAVAFGLAVLFCATAAFYHVLGWRLGLLAGAYMLIPVLCVQMIPARRAVVDIVVVLLLWLPLEFGVGGSLVPRRAQGVLHVTAYGIALVLAVMLFLLVRKWCGMRYQVPARLQDAGNALAGYAVAAATLIPLGLRIGFLEHPHEPHIPPMKALGRFAAIFFATAFPEEILFRSLIQNWLLMRLRRSWQAIVIAGVVFGAAHLDNGPQPLPNWRYMIEATIAGWIFGAVFARSTTVLASAAVHAAVDMTKWLFF
jgi:membrane protease YdiL (CAAX protease family)